MVFRVTVLPPVLGPVIIMVSKSEPRRREIGTTFLGSISGWRALRSSTLPLSFMMGAQARIWKASFALAKITSSCTSMV